MPQTHEYKLLKSTSEPGQADAQLAREAAGGWKPLLMSAANDKWEPLCFILFLSVRSSRPEHFCKFCFITARIDLRYRSGADDG